MRHGPTFLVMLADLFFFVLLAQAHTTRCLLVDTGLVWLLGQVSENRLRGWKRCSGHLERELHGPDGAKRLSPMIRSNDVDFLAPCPNATKRLFALLTLLAEQPIRSTSNVSVSRNSNSRLAANLVPKCTPSRAGQARSADLQVSRQPESSTNFLLASFPHLHAGSSGTRAEDITFTQSSTMKLCREDSAMTQVLIE